MKRRFCPVCRKRVTVQLLPSDGRFWRHRGRDGEYHVFSDAEGPAARLGA
jgi:hypothetical protein